MAKKKQNDRKEAFREYLEGLLSASSASTYLRAVNYALEHYPDDPIQLLHQKNLSHSSRHTYMSALRQWADFIEDKDFAEKLHSKELRRSFKDALRQQHSKKVTHGVQPFSKDEEKSIFDVLANWREDYDLPEWQWPAISIMFALGLRAGVDLAWLTKTDVEDALRTHQLTIVTKGSKERTVPAVTVLEELEALSKISRPWVILADLIATGGTQQVRVRNAYEKIRRCVKKLAEDAGIPQGEMHTHRLRHNTAERMYVASGGDIKMVQELLGHNSPNTTWGYLKRTRTDEIGELLLKAMKKVKDSRGSDE
jgi:site-specific recombinase XerD